MSYGRHHSPLRVRVVASVRPTLAACALVGVLATSTTTLGQGASGVRLSAPPRSIRTAVAEARPIATGNLLPTTPAAPATDSIIRGTSRGVVASPGAVASPSTVGTPIPTAAPSAGAPAAAAPKALWPYSAEAFDKRSSAPPRTLFSPAASSRLQTSATDPFSGARPPLGAEIVPSSPAAGMPKLGDGNVFVEAPHDDYFGDSRFPYDPSERLDWTPQFLPAGLIYRSYLAGVKESRMATVFEHDTNYGWIWDITLGGRVGLFRYGSANPIRPEGFQIDLEGSAQPRLDLENNEDLMAVDFRAGLPITYGIGRWSTKLAVYHLSSHVGDEYLVTHPGFQRRNYVRDEFVLGQSYYITDDLRLYGEIGWAFNADIAKPWEFQFGADYSPLAPSKRGNPFAAINGHIRQEQNFSGNLVVQAGWQWRPWDEGKLLRVGVQYYNGKSNQFEFYDRFENKVGIGIWYDF